MNAKILYRIVFVGNEPYKNHRRELNNLKRLVRGFGAELQEDDYWNLMLLSDLYKSTKYYVRKFISGVFKISIFKNSKSKLEFQNPEIEISRNRNSEHP